MSSSLKRTPKPGHVDESVELCFKKSALETLFQDVFVVAHQPATKTTMELVEEELTRFKSQVSGYQPLSGLM